MSEVVTISAATTPDWATIDDEIHCPLCDYNLRGLPEPRCPECGYRFDWRDLLDPTRRKHPFVFEHHPERNLWSFYRTLHAGLRPTRFWRSLHPTQPARLRRLILYAAVSAAIVGAANTASVIGGVFSLAQSNQDFRRRIQRSLQHPVQAARLNARIAGNFPSVDAWLDMIAPPTFSAAFLRDLGNQLRLENRLILVCGVYATWPLLTLTALLIFRWSMRRARVRTIHVLRCIVYSFDASIWMTAGFLVVTVVAAALNLLGNMSGPTGQTFDILILCVLASLTVMTYRLYVGYKVYLQFDRPLATAVASQVIVLLTTLNIVLFVTFGR